MPTAASWLAKPLAVMIAIALPLAAPSAQTEPGAKTELAAGAPSALARQDLYIVGLKAAPLALYAG